VGTEEVIALAVSSVLASAIAMAGWVAGCAAIWSALFATGSILYGRWPQALFLLVVFAASALALGWVMRRLWPRDA